MSLVSFDKSGDQRGVVAIKVGGLRQNAPWLDEEEATSHPIPAESRHL